MGMSSGSATASPHPNSSEIGLALRSAFWEHLPDFSNLSAFGVFPAPAFTAKSPATGSGINPQRRMFIHTDVDVMRRLIAVLFGILLGGGGVYVAFSYHIVKSDDDLLFVPKRQASLESVYSDIRGWGLREWGENPELARTLTEHGHGDLITHTISGELFDNLLPRFNGAARDEPGLRRE